MGPVDLEAFTNVLVILIVYGQFVCSVWLFLFEMEHFIRRPENGSHDSTHPHIVLVQLRFLFLHTVVETHYCACQTQVGLKLERKTVKHQRCCLCILETPFFVAHHYKEERCECSRETVSGVSPSEIMASVVCLQQFLS